MAIWTRAGSSRKRKWRSFEWTWYQWGKVRAKGWWVILTVKDPLWRWYTELKIAVGGEDNMLQFEFGLPLIGKVAVGFRVPRRLTGGWVHHRRELGLELRGIWPTFYIGWDSNMGDMHDYYRQQYTAQGQPLPDYLNRVTLHPGWKLSLGPVWFWLLQNRVLGSVQIEKTPLRSYEGVELALPEGVYVGTVSFRRERLHRPRWRTYRDDIIGEWDSEHWLVFPGKGENSWDCGDDGFKEYSVTIRPYVHEESLHVDIEDVALVVSKTIAGVLRQRGRYGGLNWKPEEMGVMR
jgi:hypothetical protein